MVLTSAQSLNMEKAKSNSAETQEDQDTTDKLVKLLNLFKFTIIVMFLYIHLKYCFTDTGTALQPYIN